MSNRYNNYEKKRRIVAGVIVVILVAAMILPLLVYALYRERGEYYEKVVERGGSACESAADVAGNDCLCS